MPHHIDVISNEPLAGRQKLLARLWPEHDGVAVDTGADQERGDQVLNTLRQIVPDIDQNDDPEGFIAAVQDRVDYVHLTTGALHDDEDCPFDSVGSEITGAPAPQEVPSAQPA